MRLTSLGKWMLPHSIRRRMRASWARWTGDIGGCPEVWAKASPKWHIDGIRHSASGTAVSGWLARRVDDPTRYSPRWNGRPFAQIEWCDRPDLREQIRWLTPSAGWKADGFLARTGAHPDLPGPGGWYRLELADGAGVILPEMGPPWSLRAPAENDLPWPDPVRRQRVHGGWDLEPFQLIGATVFQRLRDALLECRSADFADFPSALDWGCGCARVSRYLADIPGCQLTGVDIDADNVDWCRANLPFGHFETVPLHPPTVLPTAGFDLAFGISVMTHLKEADQFEWLAELARVVRPGGTVLLTYHGDAAVGTRLTKQLNRQRLRAGIIDIANVQYDAALSERDYYRNTFHSDEYIRREWSAHFEVTHLLPMWIGIQDLVVLRRR